MPSTQILICLHCDLSLTLPRGELPDRCPLCREVGFWRVSLPEELTASDRRLLRVLGIAADLPQDTP